MDGDDRHARTSPGHHHLQRGLVSADPAIDGEKLTRDWLRNIYHSAADESDQKLDYASGARWARTNLDLAVAIATKFGR